MAVVSANVRAPVQVISITPEERKYRVPWVILTNSRSDGGLTVSGSLPAGGTALSVGNDIDAFAVVTHYGSITLVDETDSEKLWHADVFYGTRSPFDICTADLNLNPLAFPPKLWTQTVKRQKALIEDNAGNAIVNAAGDPFDGLAQDVSETIQYIQKNQAVVDEAQWDDFADSVNSTTFFGLGARMWKAEKPNYTVAFEGNCQAYYVCTYAFESNHDTWDLELIERGLRARPAAGQPPAIPKDPDTDQRAVMPVNLAADGTELGDGDPLVTSTHKHAQERNFAQLNIPTSK